MNGPGVVEEEADIPRRRSGGDEAPPRPRCGRGSAEARGRAEVSSGQGRGERAPEKEKLRRSWKRRAEVGESRGLA
eukprot:3645796-Rhodomonas_salina.1